MPIMKLIRKELLKMHCKKKSHKLVQPLCVNIVSFHQFALEGVWLESIRFCIVLRP
jgi:hypothetical protein